METYGLQQLTAAARSAAAVHSWLNSAAGRLPVPLGTARLVVSPSAAEPADGALATRENVRRAALAWREDCASDRDNVAFFYFAGHGVQRTRTDAALLLRDFNDAPGAPLYNAMDVNNLFDGMAPTVDRPNIARTQLWFMDACRAYPSQFDHFETLTATPVFEVSLSDYDDRCAPIYFGSLPGANAYSVPGGQTVFSTAILECLEGAGCTRRAGDQWEVTVGSLAQSLGRIVELVNEEIGGSQQAFVGGQLTRTGAPIVAVTGVPSVRVSLELRPETYVDEVQLAVRCYDGSDRAIPAPLSPNPYKDRWPAGIYDLSAQPPDRGIRREQLWVLPPDCPWVGQVTVP